VPQVGWYGRTFVFPDSTIPADATEVVIYQSAARGENFYQVKGRLEEWRDQIGRRCVGNSRLVFSVSAAFAGPLVRPLNVESGGFHVKGLSSTGKTTCQWLAGSVCGGHGYVRSWRSTDNALELAAQLCNDGLLILDEIREVEAKDVDRIMYMLGNGAGKNRMTKSMTAHPTPAWQILWLSSGEIKVSEHAAGAGTRTKGGSEIRCLNIPADTDAGMGIFEDIHNAESPRVFAEQLKAATTRTYGTPLRAFIELLVRDWEARIAWAAEFVEKFTRDTLPAGAASEVGRALRRIALVAAAGEMATCMGITGWQPGEARRAALRCFKDWIADRGGIGQADTEAGIRQVRAFIEMYGAGRFQPVVSTFPHGERLNDRAGFWRDEDDERLYLVFPEVFKNQVCRDFDYRLIAMELLKRGLLVKGEGRNLARYERVPNEGRVRLYVIRARILEDGEEAAD
jgi:uncharacterized protein (DUF927 family)